MVKELECGIEVNYFEFQFRYQVHSWTYNHGNAMKHLILLAIYHE